MKIFVRINFLRSKEVKIQYEAKYAEYWSVVKEFATFLYSNEGKWLFDKARESFSAYVKANIWTKLPAQSIYESISFISSDEKERRFWIDGKKVYRHEENYDHQEDAEIVHIFSDGSFVILRDPGNSFSSYEFIRKEERIAVPANPEYEKEEDESASSSTESYDASGNEGFEYYYDM